MKDDFRKYATRHLGLSSMVVDDVISAQNQYLNPYILEERQLNVTQMDVFSRLMMDRIIFLGTEIDDYTANTLQAQLLYLDSADPGKDIPAAAFTQDWASTTRCNSSQVTLPRFVPEWPPAWPPFCSWRARKASAAHCRIVV